MASPPPPNSSLPGGLQKETTHASIAAAAEAAPSPTQQPSPERPRRHLRTAPSLVGFRRRLPLHPSQPQRSPLLLLHSSQDLNGLAATSGQLPPWWASEGDLPPASIAATAEATPSPAQQPSPERPCRNLRTASSLVGFEGDYPAHPSQPQRRPLLLLHSSQVLNDFAATSEQLPPWWASEGDYPRIYRSRSRGRSFSYTAAKS
ncbi:hypothetical protein NDU88_008172 [Pleurodeles waltl]|uniref:Uncharacterized protein n=1 Tax=Pleurodeles waltl TaxID=8319 RepID=A0AAV7U2K4_PLEWA|nr:hypothetical protein NDU88_008172 [Pleurodeles waltl]